MKNTIEERSADRDGLVADLALLRNQQEALYKRMERMNLAFEELDTAFNIQNSTLGNYLESLLNLTNIDCKWVDTLLDLCKTLVTIASTILIGALALKDDNSYIRKDYLAVASILVIILSFIAIYALVKKRGRIVTKYRAMHEWINDKVTAKLDVSYSKAQLAKLKVKLNETDDAIGEIERKLNASK